MVLTTVGQTHTLTIGKFTIGDVNNKAVNGGCSGITLSGSTNFWYNATGDNQPPGGPTWTAKAGGSTFYIQTGLAAPAPGGGIANWLFQAYDPATPSFVTGAVGDSNPTGGSGTDQTPPLPSGVIPCVDIGGAAGA